MFFAGYIAWYTATLIIKHSYGHHDFAFRCKEVLGSWSYYLAQLISVLVVLVAEISYHIFLAQNLYKVVNAFFEFFDSEAPHWWTQKLCAVFVAIILIPLVINPFPEVIIRISSFAIIIVLSVAIIVVVTGFTPDDGIQMDDIEYTNKKFFKSLGTLSLSFFAHNVLFTIIGNPVHPNHNSLNLFVGYTIDILIYALVGAAGYLGYHKYTDPDTGEIKDISSNYLLMFESDYIPIFVARLLLVIQMFIVYPVIYRTLRTSFYNTFLPRVCFSYGTYCDCAAAREQYRLEIEQEKAQQESGSASAADSDAGFSVNSGDENTPLIQKIGAEQDDEEEAQSNTSQDREGNFFLLQIPTALVVIAITMIFPLLDIDVGDVTSYAGSVCGFFYVFLLPCLVHIKLQYQAWKTAHSQSDYTSAINADDETSDEGYASDKGKSKKPQNSFLFICDVIIHSILIVYGALVVIMQFVVSL